MEQPNSFNEEPEAQQETAFSQPWEPPRGPSLFKRVFIPTFIVVILVTLAVAFVHEPANEELLAGRTWCVERITYDGKTLPVHTTGMTVTVDGCSEMANFQKSTHMALPGFNTIPAYGYWRMQDGKVLLSAFDSHHEIYEGLYVIVSVSEETLKLQSEHTVIELRASR
jgi:hypothetical protein